MASPESSVPLGAIRQAADEAVRAVSLRSVAVAIGMSPTNLRHFINGQTPYRATRRKLIAWYVRYQLDRRAFSGDTARAAMEVLLEGIPADQVNAVERQLLDALGAFYDGARVPPPAWLPRLRGGAE
jgi:hypothetical protein